jgi:hypothetical protein
MGDPLNPIVPIHPAPLEPPAYARVTPIEREQQREPAPDWDQAEEDAQEEREQEYDDDYDPDWGKWAPLEPVSEEEPAPETKRARTAWDPARSGDRRVHSESADDADDERPGPHIDITA